MAISRSVPAHQHNVSGINPVLSTPKIVDCRLVQTQDEYVRILRDVFGRKIDIKDNDFFRRRRLDAAVIDIEVRKTCSLSGFQAESTSISFFNLAKTIILAMIVPGIKLLAFIGITGPLRKFSGPSP